VSFAAEPYGVFVDDLVSSLTGGITREELVFLPENAPFRLGFRTDFLPATVRVHGLVETAFFRFRPDVDYEIDTVDGSIVWLEGDPGLPAAGARWPDRGSRFYLSYERKPEVRPTPPLTDRNPGSVLRTLAESFAREYAVLSKQLERVYEAGFLTTAEGRDLEQVAALVGVKRHTRAVAVGEVVLSRSTPAAGDIFVQAGTLISTSEAPAITVETIEPRTLRAGTVSVAVPVQSLVAGPDGVAQGGTLTVIHRPVLGIESAANPLALTFGGEDESDDALRRRADRALEAGGRSTISALIGALMSTGIREQDIRVAEDHLAFPGTVKLTIAGLGAFTDGEKQRVVDLITEYRPAGVRVLHNVPVPPPASLPPGGDEGGEPPGPMPEPAEGAAEGTSFFIGVKAAVTPASATLSAAQKATLRSKVEETIRASIGQYGLGQTVVYNKLVSAVMAVAGVYDVSIDLFPDDGVADSGRMNLVPQPPDTRPELRPDPDANLTVTLRGALVALDVSLNIQRLGVAATLDPATAIAAARDDIRTRLVAFAADPPTTIDPTAILDHLTDTESYHVNDPIGYTAEFLDDGLRILRPNVDITLDAEQQLWIRVVNVVEGG
jgi:uncharacterized phage protein gp47/JayE